MKAAQLRNFVERHGVFLAANVALVVTAYAVFLWPVLAYLGDRDDVVAEKRAALARYEAIAAQESAIERYAAQVADSNARGELLAGETDGVVNANLQSRLKSASESAGVTVRSIQSLPTKALRGVTLFGARLEVAGPLDAVHALLVDLEGHAPLLLVFSASMRGGTTSWGVAQPPAEGADQIEVVLDVYGGAALKERS